MAVGKTHSRFVTISINSLLVTCSITSSGGVGLTHEQTDITTLCNTIMENLQGTGSVTLDFSGFLDNDTLGSHTVVQPLADAGTLVPIVVAIGIGAAPTSGDPEFTMTNMLLQNYLVSPSTGSAVTNAWNAVGGEGVTAVWGTVT
jgi:hypothetical protein